MARQVCAIVGAGEGLGQSLARRFAREGFDMALLSRSEEGSAAALQAAKDEGSNANFFAADAARPETIEEALSMAGETLGAIDVLIYNVRGTFGGSEPLDLSYADLEGMFQIEVIGAFAAAKAILPSMRTKGRGSVFFSSATAAFRGSANYGLYSIGKFGLRALSQSLTKAYAKDGIHFAHFRLDCDLDVPVMQELYGEKYDPAVLADPDGVAEAYWLTHLQPRSAWSNEVELRPFTETWTC